MSNASSILIVDDDRDSAEALAAALIVDGYQATCAQDGREAVERLKVSPLPHLILLDLQMPVMNGWQFLLHRNKDPELATIPVIVISASPREGYLGPEAFVEKPIDLKNLLSLVRKYC